MTLYKSGFRNLCLFKASPFFHFYHCPRKYLPQHHILHQPDTSGASKSVNFLELLTNLLLNASEQRRLLDNKVIDSIGIVFLSSIFTVNFFVPFLCHVFKTLILLIPSDPSRIQSINDKKSGKSRI